MGAAEVDLRELEHRLAPVGVAALAPLAGGASSLTYTGVVDGGERRVVVKIAPPGVSPVRNRDVRREARILRALGPTGVPVPEVLWEDPGAPPAVPPLFVMAHVDGVSLEPLYDLYVDARTGEDGPAVVAERLRNAASTMGALHAIEPGDLALDDDARVPLSEEIDRWCRALETVDPALAPGWEAVADSLRATEPTPMSDAVVHGDFRLGNLLAVGTEITAVIDWEIWSISDPRVDLGWFLLNADPDAYRRPTRYVGALPTPAELADVHAATLGCHVPDQAWFEALACLKSTASWSLIVKHNRRRPTPVPELEGMASALPHLLQKAGAFLGRVET